MKHVVRVKKRFNKAGCSSKVVGTPPSLSTPHEWFAFLDSNGSGYVTQEQVISCTNASLKPRGPEEKEYIREKITESWKYYDRTGVLYLNKTQFLTCGMVQFLQDLHGSYYNAFPNDPRHNTASTNRGRPQGHPPRLQTSPMAWFSYYDADGMCRLTQTDIIQGLIETTRPRDMEEANALSQRIKNMWPLFVENGRDEISKWDFLEAGGMGDTLVAIANDIEKSRAPLAADPSDSASQPKPTQRRHSYLPPPILSIDPSGWFEHFDFKHNGHLTQREIVFALYSSFNAVTKDRQAAIMKVIKSNWARFDPLQEGFITRDNFLSTDGLASILVDLELNLNIKAVDRPADDAEEVVRIKVNIPNGMEPFNLIQVTSPKTKGLVMLSIPERTYWGGGYGTEPPFFTVKF